jgi:serine/threonine protein kinase
MISGIKPNTKDRLKKVFMFLGNDISAKDLITKMLNVHPDNRPNIKEIKRHMFFKDIDWKDINESKSKPYFIPDLNGLFDSQYFEDSASCKHKALYFEVGEYHNKGLLTSKFKRC